jgi:hypothetical protein
LFSQEEFTSFLIEVHMASENQSNATLKPWEYAHSKDVRPANVPPAAAAPPPPITLANIIGQ